MSATDLTSIPPSLPPYPELPRSLYRFDARQQASRRAETKYEVRGQVNGEAKTTQSLNYIVETKGQNVRGERKLHDMSYSIPLEEREG